jgi:hypothetical protein
MNRTARDRRSLIVGLLLFGAASCVGGGGDGAPATSVPVVTPSSAYGPFPYSDPAQRNAYETFLACAADHGIEYEGPFTDANGEGVYLRLAPGTHASHAEQHEVDTACPELTVGIFGTPVGHVHVGPFERAANSFARCIRTHGQPTYPLPAFGGDDPVHTFWQLPFRWASGRFVSAVRACVGPLHDYLFSA